MIAVVVDSVQLLGAGLLAFCLGYVVEEVLR